MRRHEAAGGHAHRPEAVLGVGAAARVGVVVGEVRADLDEERAEQRREEAPARGTSSCVAASAVPTSTGATAAGSVRGRAAMSQMRTARTHGRRGNLREVGLALLLVGLAALARLLGARRRGGSCRARAAGCRRGRPRAALKLALSSRSANGDSASISRHQATVSSSSAVERHDGVDEPHVERLLRVVLAAQEPDLLRLLRADEVAQQRRAEAAVERADARAGLAEARVVGGDRQVADEVQDVAAADRVAGDHRDDRLGQAADLDLQVGDVEAPDASAARSVT